MGLKFQAKQKKIDYNLEIDEEIKNYHVLSDPTRISQIIYNLVGNAIKFTEKGGVDVRLALLDESEEAVSVRLSVRDTGLGISDDQKEAIFQPFTQASSSITRNYGGTGLGLAIVKSLLKLFNSAMELESQPQKGSTFSFNLSLKLDTEHQQTESQDVEDHFDLDGMRILVAEDNAMNRILLTKIFSNWNCRPSFALNGKEAIEKLSSENFDVVLMDIHMPVMDGYEAVRIIRSSQDTQKSNLPIIALTASVSGNLPEKITSVGMDGFVSKPFKLKDLYDKIKECSIKTS
jgi:CheY-like chemotaxis protein